MGVRIEWATAGDLHLVREEDDVVDEHGATLEPGNVGLAAKGCVIEGPAEELAAKLEELAAELRNVAVDGEVVEERRALPAGACPACGDPDGPCEIAPCGDPSCTSRDCESHDACEPAVTT